MDDYSPVERLDDSQFRRHMQNLEELIHQHVENHYHSRPYTGRLVELEAALTGCGYTDQTEPSTQTMANLLVNPAKRNTAIRSLLASVILKAVDLRNGPENSLLPDVITQFYHMIPKNRRANEKDGMSLTPCHHVDFGVIHSISLMNANIATQLLTNPSQDGVNYRPTFSRTILHIMKAHYSRQTLQPSAF
jgi:hypothetical protein